MFLYCFGFFFFEALFLAENYSVRVVEAFALHTQKSKMDFNDDDGALCWLFHVLLPSLLCIYDYLDFISYIVFNILNNIELSVCFLKYSAFATDSSIFYKQIRRVVQPTKKLCKIKFDTVQFRRFMRIAWQFS